MIHARKDYNRIQDPALKDESLLSPGSTPIDEDEPVFLVRAKDQAFIKTLCAWIHAHEDAGGDKAMSKAVEQHIELAVRWRMNHVTKIADAPIEILDTTEE